MNSKTKSAITPILDPLELTKLAKYWNVYWEKIPYDQNDYNINHTATVFMIDGNGDFSGTIAWGESEGSVSLKIKNLINAS